MGIHSALELEKVINKSIETRMKKPPCMKDPDKENEKGEKGEDEDPNEDDGYGIGR